PRPPRHHHSFPTRRSSDLAKRRWLQRPLACLTANRQRQGQHAARIARVDQAVIKQARTAVEGVRLLLERAGDLVFQRLDHAFRRDRKSTRLNSSHVSISYA